MHALFSAKSIICMFMQQKNMQKSNEIHFEFTIILIFLHPV